jgi:Ca2+-binding EF-hand superfamily protein
VIDLDGDGIKLVNINRSNAMFDLTGSGFANKTGWISSGDAFLVWDRNNDNRINGISEMFGSATQSGFKALSLYDTNRDGRIDAFDDVFKNLKLWQDRNGDGRTDEGELLSFEIRDKNCLT